MKVALVQSGVTLMRFHAASGPDVRGAVARFSHDEDDEIGWNSMKGHGAGTAAGRGGASGRRAGRPGSTPTRPKIKSAGFSYHRVVYLTARPPAAWWTVPPTPCPPGSGPG